MEFELAELLTGLDQSVLGKLAEHDVRSVEDGKLLTKEDFAVRSLLLSLRALCCTDLLRDALRSWGSRLGCATGW